MHKEWLNRIGMEIHASDSGRLSASGAQQGFRSYRELVLSVKIYSEEIGNEK